MKSFKEFFSEDVSNKLLIKRISDLEIEIKKLADYIDNKLLQDDQSYFTSGSMNRDNKELVSLRVKLHNLKKELINPQLKESNSKVKIYAVEYKQKGDLSHRMARIMATSIEDAREKAKTTLGLGHIDFTIVDIHLFEK